MKNIIICGLVGTSFLLSGFWFGLRIAPMPKPKPAAAALAKTDAKTAPRDAISLETLRATTENMVAVNQALQAREQAVAAREKKVQQDEDEVVAEHAALDRLHAQFHQLYSEFQNRLQLVDDNETDQLQRQVSIFNAMDPAQSADLVRALDDGTVTRLFSIMETKPLSKLVAAWKVKYPADSTRLLTDLNGMGRVMTKAKVVLPADAPSADAGSTGASDAPAQAPTLDAAAPRNNERGRYRLKFVRPTASADSAHPRTANPMRLPRDTDGCEHPGFRSNTGTAPPDAGTSAPTAPPSAFAPEPAASPSSAFSPDPTGHLARSRARASLPTASPSASTTGDGDSPLGTPGETAARANGAAPSDSDPSDSTPPPATVRPNRLHSSRLASA